MSAKQSKTTPIVIKKSSGWGSSDLSFAKLSPAEICDSRMSDGEKILLAWLRFRAGGKTSTFAGWDAIAQDLNSSTQTVMRQIKRLKDLGILKCQTRGYSNTSHKIISDPDEIYSDEITSTHTVYKYLRHDRTAEELDLLHSKNLSDVTSDVTDEHTPKSSDSAITLKNETSELSFLIPPSLSDLRVKVDEDEVEQEEGEKDFSALDAPHHRSVSKISEESEDRHVVHIPHVGNDSDVYYPPKTSPPYSEEESGTGIPRRPLIDAPPAPGPHTGTGPTPPATRTPSPTLPLPGLDTSPPATEPRDADLERARALVTSTSQKASRLTQERAEKRARGRTAGSAFEAAEAKVRAKEQRRLESQTPGSKFAEWAIREYDTYFPEVKMPRWGKIEFSQYKTLVESVDGDDALVRKSWTYLCENWDLVVKNLKIKNNAPTIGLLLAFKGRIIPDAQARKTSRQEVEHAAKPANEWDKW